MNKKMTNFVILFIFFGDIAYCFPKKLFDNHTTSIFARSKVNKENSSNQTYRLYANEMDTSVIYSLPLNDIDGNPINLSQFQGKKILIVNTATNSNYISQYDSLEQLYQKYKDSLIIIAIPSNSFGNESNDNATIKNFVMSNYHIHYILAQKMDVTGDAQSALYSWLTHIEQNNMMSNDVEGDFFKFLIDKSGRLVGAFVPSVDPMSDDMQSVITN
jgi:glutathione peroxidase